MTDRKKVTIEDPRFVTVSLQRIVDDGILLAANEAFFWPLGLSLTYMADGPEGEYADDLHIREWREGVEWNGEDISASVDDTLVAIRRLRFKDWRKQRIDKIEALSATRDDE